MKTSNCTDRGLTRVTWRKSSYSQGNGACVEVADNRAFIPVRDSKDVSLRPLIFSFGSWSTFIDAVKKGRV
ncbi:DUF397 domain-containing protein [Streptomyces iconiensis]|uniref:DUF397 domain-containing protein n=1 Tax=Streptomyces iconiensis TaxID=1384038 RepID=A0ABT6ZN17_9ACTN|nr:DUF397 domain-containing protein [Streptomyces iconiensis]MDJ1130439.1 DUF397 domain-containing protein [Streptomyces iconiensis]